MIRALCLPGNAAVAPCRHLAANSLLHCLNRARFSSWGPIELPIKLPGMKLRPRFTVPGKSSGAQCYGCGGIIESGEVAHSDIVPMTKSQAQKKNRRYALCNRCRLLKKTSEGEKPNNAESPNEPLDIEVFRREVAKSQNSPAWVVHVVDATDVEGTLIRAIRSFIGKNPLVLAVTKCDLLPEDVTDERIQNTLKKYIADRAKQKGLSCHEVFLISGKQNSGVAPLVDYIHTNLHGKNVYMVGNANVGKSTLVQAFCKRCFELIDLKHFLARKRRRKVLRIQPTTSCLPGTTLMSVRIPCFESHRHALYDTPGLFPIRYQWAAPALQKQIMLKPLRLDFNRRTLLVRRWRVVGHPVMMEVIHPAGYSGNDAGAWYSNLGVDIEPVPYDLSPPDGTTLLKTVHPRQDARGMYSADLVVLDLGWFAISAMEDGVTINLFAPKQSFVTVRPVMFNPIYAGRQIRWIEQIHKVTSATVNNLVEDAPVTRRDRYMAKAPKPQFRADREEESSESALDRHRKKLSKIVDGGDLGFGDVAHHHYTFDHQEYVEERPISRRPLGGYRAEFDQDLPTPFDLSQPDASHDYNPIQKQRSMGPHRKGRVSAGLKRRTDVPDANKNNGVYKGRSQGNIAPNRRDNLKSASVGTNNIQSRSRNPRAQPTAGGISIRSSSRYSKPSKRQPDFDDFDLV